MIFLCSVPTGVGPVDPEAFSGMVTTDFAELFTFLRSRLRRRSLLVLLTSLDDPLVAESFFDNIDLIARRHLVLVNMIRPAGLGPLFSRTTEQAPAEVVAAASGPRVGPAGSIDDVYADLAGHLRWQRLRELERNLHHHGVSFRLVDSEALCPELVSQYLSVKSRQLL